MPAQNAHWQLSHDTVLELPVNLRYVHRVRLQPCRDDREKVLAYDKDDLLISV